MGEPDSLEADLRARGIDTTDFGRFVNRAVPGITPPSTFDDARATPVLLKWLPRVEERFKAAVVGHLNNKAAKGIAAEPLLGEFRKVAEDHLRWQIGDVLTHVATPEHYDQIVELAGNRGYGWSRQMLVDMLWRIKTDESRSILVASLDDPDVALHAGSALRRLIGNAEALKSLEPLLDHPDESVAFAARTNAARARKSEARRLARQQVAG